MARNGSGVYILPVNSFNPAVNGGTIESSSWNATANDLAAALTQSISRDGQTTVTGNITLSGFKLTNVADGTTATDGMTYGQGAKLSGGNTWTGDQTINGSVSLSGSLTVTGPVIFTAGATIPVVSGSVSFTGPVVFVASNNSASTDPIIVLDRGTASASADNRLGQIVFRGRDSAGNPTDYASINGAIFDATNTSEDGVLEFNTIIAGSTNTRMRLFGGIYFNGLTEQGQGTVNATGYYLNNVNLLSGLCIQMKYATSVTYQTCSTAIPDDNTPPTSTEGDLVVSVTAFVPKFSTSTIVVSVSVPVFNGTAVNAAVSLFDTSVSTDAVCARQFGSNTSTFPKVISFDFPFVPGNVSSRNFNVRVGPASGSVYINGNASARTLGGVSSATIIVREYAA